MTHIPAQRAATAALTGLAVWLLGAEGLCADRLRSQHRSGRDRSDQRRDARTRFGLTGGVTSRLDLRVSPRLEQRVSPRISDRKYLAGQMRRERLQRKLQEQRDRQLAERTLRLKRLQTARLRRAQEQRDELRRQVDRKKIRIFLRFGRWRPGAF